MTVDAESLFLQFRDRREPALLGAVFDLVAAELFAVALHLCRDEAEADDILQATFLVAIERADRYDPERPLRPWLLGILHQEAKASRRRARRTPDPGRVPVPTTPQPLQAALAAEATDAVTRAITGLPQPYREVLELRLVHALPNREIATRLGRSAGAVRTQVWRGLELLRQLLPRGLALTLAAHLGLRPGLAAVRQQVIAATEAKLAIGGSATGVGSGPPFQGVGAGAGAGTAAGLIAGVSLMNKTWIVALTTLAAATVVWALWPGNLAETSLPGTASRTLPSTLTVGMTRLDSEVLETVERTALASRQPPGSIGAGTITAVQLHVVVVGGNGEPVPDAQVTLHDRAGRRRSAADHLPDPLVWQGRTDAAGSTGFQLDRELFVAAHKDGAGITGDLRLAPGMFRAIDELRLVLRPAVRVTGSVLLPDGSPAGGARVVCRADSGGTTPLAPESPAALVVGSDGRFSFLLVVRPHYRFRAWLGDRSTEPVGVDTGHHRADRLSDREIVLRFPGAFSVRGRMFGADGRPVSGSVRLLPNPARPGDPLYGPPFESAEVDGEGRFTLLLTGGGAFDLIGGAAGQTADQLAVVLDATQPHREVTLRLNPFTVLAGHAVDERGDPCPGIHVSVQPIDTDSALRRCRLALQGPLRGATTAADGAFRMMVPSGTRYRLAYHPTRRLRVEGPELLPPAEDVRLIVRDPAASGFTITGRVLEAATGATVPAFRVYLIEHSRSGTGFSDSLITKGQDGRFEIEPLSIDRRYSLRIEAEELADTELGPFDATVRREAVVARMPALGSLAGTVLRPDGTPAFKARVALERFGKHSFARAHQGETDADGGIRLRDVVPDRYTVYARAESAEGGQVQRVVRIEPGRRTSIVLKLQD